MTSPENPAFNLAGYEFESYPTYKNLSRAPKIVVAQTDSIIQLSNAGVISTDFIDNYLSTYTIPFLRSAAQGVGRVYGRSADGINPLSLELSEAADFTNVVFSWMHYFARSRYLPDGFSRYGILRAPKTSGEFVGRVLEIKEELLRILNGKRSNGTFLESSPQALRTFTFFKVGGSMPLKFMESDRERKEHEAYILEKLLDGIDTNF